MRTPNSFTHRPPWLYSYLRHKVFTLGKPSSPVETSPISILHPTRRPKMAIETRRQWLKGARHPDNIEYIFAIDEDDAASLSILADYRSVIVRPGGKSTRALNEAAKASSGDILIAVADDIEAPPAWDDSIFRRLSHWRGKQAILAVSDGHRRDRLVVTAILTRARYLSKGYILHPDYECCGVYADNEFTDQAYREGVMVEAFDLIFEHHHPNFTGGQLDEIHKRHNNVESYELGLQIYNRRKAANFP